MRFLIGIPVYNEAGYIDGVLGEVRKYASDIFVVNDGSTDGTGERLAAHGDIVVHTHEQNQGYGASTIDIFNHAIEQRYDWLITLDADEQHEPAAIADFRRLAEGGAADIISGSRYTQQSLRTPGSAPNDRRWINCQITCLLRDITGYELSDSFCGFKAYRVEGLGKLHLTDMGYAVPLQLWIQAWKAGLRVVELPVKLIYVDPNRTFGGTLDDSEQRLRYYLDTIGRELGYSVHERCDGLRAECRCR